MAKTPFVHLHVHSDYSLLDGACRLDRLVETAAREGMPAVALTDHGNLFGAISFYRAALEAGIKPIIGYEAYLAPGDRRDRSARSARDAVSHLTLLAQNETGYRNLVRLASYAYLDGLYYRPRIDRALLAEHADGLICLSGCASSELARHLANGRYEEARQVAAFYRDLFGPERYFIEIQDNGLEVQRRCLEPLVRLARELGLSCVATNDTHYMSAEDALAHEALLCINTGTLLSDGSRLRLGTDQFYFKSGEEMQRQFSWIPEALDNTLSVADRCNLELDFQKRHFPRFVPEDGRSDAAMLRDLCLQGARERYGEILPEVRQRLEYELDVIVRMGYASYFLICWDITNFARRHRIPHGLRGSGGGSMVSYVLHISDIDPLAQGLLFERFLDPERKEAPDLDLDFCEMRREEVIRYVRQKYGEDRTAQIITFGTLAARGVVRDVGRVLGMPLPAVDQIAKLIPGGPKVKLKESVQKEPELKRRYEEDAAVRRLIDLSLRLEGLARHASVHAAGLVLADRPLMDLIPLYKRDNTVCSQYAMEDLDRVGMLKLDLLGLRTLTIIDRALDLVEEKVGQRPDLERLPLDDEKTYEFLSTGDTRSVFQVGGEGIQDLLHRMKPAKLSDITAVVALYRPGPLQAGVVDQFLDRKHGRTQIAYVHPSLEPILRDTYGVIVYQEQIMQIAHQVAGMELGDALTMIKAISKKKDAIIGERRQRFVEGAVRNGLPPEAARAVFDDISKFAQYGFNKAHATAYAYLAYRTAWLRAHHPVEYIAAAMTSEMQDSDKIAGHFEECRAMGIEVLPPSVNRSSAHFTVEDGDKIRFGLGAVRNAGLAAMEELVRARKRVGGFRSLYHFCEEVDLHKVNRQAIESLIKAGAFDDLHPCRAAMVAALDEALRAGQAVRRDRQAGQGTFFDALEDASPVRSLPDVPEWPRDVRLDYEEEALGFHLSEHPLDENRWLIEALSTTSSRDLAERENGTRVVLGGRIRELRQMFDKRGQSMAHLLLEDLDGAVRCVLFADAFERNGPLLEARAKVFVLGRADVRAERPSVQVEEVIPFERAVGRLCECIRLRLKDGSERERDFERLRVALSAHPGRCPVEMDLVRPDEVVTIRVSPNLYVTPGSELLDALEAIVGRDALELVPIRDPKPQWNRGRRWNNGGRKNGG